MRLRLTHFEMRSRTLHLDEVYTEVKDNHILYLPQQIKALGNYTTYVIEENDLTFSLCSINGKRTCTLVAIC